MLACWKAGKWSLNLSLLAWLQMFIILFNTFIYQLLKDLFWQHNPEKNSAPLSVLAILNIASPFVIINQT